MGLGDGPERGPLESSAMEGGSGELSPPHQKYCSFLGGSWGAPRQTHHDNFAILGTYRVTNWTKMSENC